MVNTLETSQAVNNSIDTTGLGDESTFIAESFSDPYHEQRLTALVDAWLPKLVSWTIPSYSAKEIDKPCYYLLSSQIATRYPNKHSMLRLALMSPDHGCCFAKGLNPIQLWN